MSLNNIQLKDNLLADLYKNSLVETYSLVKTNSLVENSSSLETNSLVETNPLVEKGIIAVSEKISVPGKKQVKYFGNNQKNIVVIVSHSSVPFLPDPELSFLSNILAACKLSIADIAIINNNNTEPNDVQSIIDSEGKNVLLFGLEPLSIGLPINFPVFQLQAFNNRTYLHAPALEQIEADKELKKRLWASLKALFGI